MSSRRTCFGCDRWFTPATPDNYFCDRCQEELTEVNAANRATAIRKKLWEAAETGTLGVIAAKSCTSEGMLRDWLNKPALSPNRNELTRIERALGLLPEEAPQIGDAATDVPIATS